MADQQDAQRQVTARWAEIDALAKQLQGTIRTGFGKNTMVFHTKAARQLGIPLPEDSHVRADGRVGKNTNDIKFALMAAGAMAAPFVAPAVAGALGGGAAVTGPAVGAPGFVGPVAGGAAAGTTAAATAPVVASTVGLNPITTTGAALGGSSFWNVAKKIAEIGVPAAAGIYGAKKTADAYSDAAKIEAETAEKALALEEEMYERRRADLTPYRIAGQGAAATLSNLMGIAQPNMGTVSARPPAGTPAAQEIPVPPSATPAPAVPGQAAPRGNLTPPSSGATRMRAPDGTVRLIPPDQVQQALANGGQMVS